MQVRTFYDPPPIPSRTCDWSAIDDSTYDGGDEFPGPVGYGATEAEAVADLIDQIESAA